MDSASAFVRVLDNVYRFVMVEAYKLKESNNKEIITLSLLLSVGLIWGITNAFIKQGAQEIESKLKLYASPPIPCLIFISILILLNC